MAIYFIRAGNFIKIGYAVDPYSRLKQLQTGNPQKLELVGYVEGDYETEAHIHSLFADFRVKGEWFELNTDIMAYAEKGKHRVALAEKISNMFVKKPKKKGSKARKTVPAYDLDNWREERREYVKANGETSVYINYRRRKGDTVDGKRKNVYAPAGKLKKRNSSK